METTVSNIDEQLKNCIAKLSLSRKKSILGLITYFAEEDEVEERPQTLEEYNRELEEAEKRIEAGEYYTHDEVKALMNSLFK